MDAVHLASSIQVHLSFNGVIVEVGTPATRQFLRLPIEIRFATLVAAAQPIFDCPPQAFPDGKLHHRRLPGPVPHRAKLRVHDFIDQDPLDWSLGTEFLNDRFTHAAVDRSLLGKPERVACGGNECCKRPLIRGPNDSRYRADLPKPKSCFDTVQKKAAGVTSAGPDFVIDFGPFPRAYVPMSYSWDT